MKESYLFSDALKRELKGCCFHTKNKIISTVQAMFKQFSKAGFAKVFWQLDRSSHEVYCSRSVALDGEHDERNTVLKWISSCSKAVVTWVSVFIEHRSYFLFSRKRSYDLMVPVTVIIYIEFLNTFSADEFSSSKFEYGNTSDTLQLMDVFFNREEGAENTIMILMFYFFE